MKNASQQIAKIGAGLIEGLGRLSGWMLFALILLQFAVVIARYILSTNFLWAQELVIYLHAAIILFAISWAFLENKHVRLDILSNTLGRKGRRVIEIFGTLFLLFPFSLVVLYYSKNYVWQSWAVLEGSAELSGLPGIFLVKTLILVFAILLLIAGWLKLQRRSPL